MTAEGEKIGVLQIEVDSKLYYRGEGVRVEIRDSDLILIQPATTQRSFDLPHGLYEISAVLEDGKRTNKVAEVNGKYPNRIKLEPNLPFEPLASKNDIDFRSISELQQLKTVKTDMEIFDVSSDVTVYEVESHWILRHSQIMEQVPVVTINRAGSTVQASLPISAGDHRFSVTCHVTRQSEPSFGPVQIKISQSRSIASAMERMVEAGQFESATRLANKALETLLSKFVDPTGAALAALILYKADRLNDKLGLLHSLVKRFGWLPDGKILLASQLVRLPGQREKALQLACQASEQRILFTETFSLLLDLLRYWPEESDSKARSEALSRLSNRAPFVDWRSTYLCDRLQEDHDANAATSARA
jgi:Arc/MetJ-type ribon-helix-helix transcriptional regulator